MIAVKIQTNSKTLEFSVYSAISQNDREKGLMGVEHLQENEGMIFPQKEIGHIRVWMKGTIIPLDIVFIDQNGIIINIDNNAEPLSERMIWSNAEAACFLELIGGTCERKNIKIGDKVLSPIINQYLSIT